MNIVLKYVLYRLEKMTVVIDLLKLFHSLFQLIVEQIIALKKNYIIQNLRNERILNN